ncbi:hypothetical protein CAC42_3860 [Sphaceloma murrayae]|uniref:AB hydrolase-1 domain-containing protein n=1 Tax=Sphaceloma murrayae TaxID=2082308 RepID=A0A2K1QS81_9PEZI|nr:hypothetical protein CAC42_3860 [Sphaceloma murrayae]
MEYPSSITKTFTVPRGFKYTFVHIAPSGSKPTILFLAGFPEPAFDWHYQVDHFKGLGYGIVAPDLLGYGATDKPTAYLEYRRKPMADDVIAILDHLEIEQVVGVGHDWGAGLLSALSAFHPTRFLNYSFLAVGYMAPGRVDTVAMNSMTKAMLGYEAFGYFEFFTESDSVSIVDGNIDSLNSLLFSEEIPNHWQTNICPRGAAREWLTARRTGALPGWLKKSDLETRTKILVHGGFTGPLNWYKQAVDPANDEDAKSALVKGIPDKPVLFIGDDRQAAMPAPMMEAMVKQACGNVTCRSLNTSHWMMLEDPQGVNRTLEEFLRDNGL